MPHLLPPLSLRRTLKVVLTLQLRDQLIVRGKLIRSWKDGGNRRGDAPLANGWCCHAGLCRVVAGVINGFAPIEKSRITR